MRLVAAITHFVVIFGYALLVLAQHGILRPVAEEYSDIGSSCQNAVQAGEASRSAVQQAPRSRQPSQETSLIVPYLPQCRSDKPDLFHARQCSQHDCFCVNVTTGLVLLGTLASPSEVGDCATALYSLLLAVKHPNGQSSLHQSADRIAEGKVELPGDLKSKIKTSLEMILSSTPGFQQVINVTQLISLNPDSTDAKAIDAETEAGKLGLVYFRIFLTSTGHAKVRDPLELLQHRLHEGFLSGVGAVDPKVSRLHVLTSRIPDPDVSPRRNSGKTVTPVTIKEVVPKVTKELLAEKHVTDQSTLHKAMALRSPGALAPVAQASLVPRGGKVERGSRELNSDDTEDTFRFRELTGAVPAGHYPGEQSEGILYQNWSARISWWNRLKQPGVIAGLVGSIVVVLLLLILLILFCVYRLRKRDEGSYALDEPHKLPTANCSYTRVPTREFYA